MFTYNISGDNKIKGVKLNLLVHDILDSFFTQVGELLVT